jgi:hypothetical protein
MVEGRRRRKGRAGEEGEGKMAGGGYRREGRRWRVVGRGSRGREGCEGEYEEGGCGGIVEGRVK